MYHKRPSHCLLRVSGDCEVARLQRAVDRVAVCDIFLLSCRPSTDFFDWKAELMCVECARIVRKVRRVSACCVASNPNLDVVSIVTEGAAWWIRRLVGGSRDRASCHSSTGPIAPALFPRVCTRFPIRHNQHYSSCRHRYLLTKGRLASLLNSTAYRVFPLNFCTRSSFSFCTIDRDVAVTGR